MLMLLTIWYFCARMGLGGFVPLVWVCFWAPKYLKIEGSFAN